MIFVTETGAGLANATSYVSVEEADAYFEQFGNEDWDGTVEEKQLALNKATRSIDLLFGQRFQSYPSYPNTQALLFPRSAFYINQWQTVSTNTIPRLLKQAVCEVALIALNDGDILPNITEDSSIAEEEMEIGPLKMKTKYSGATTSEQLEGFYQIELLLGPLLNNGGAPDHYYAYMGL